MYKKIFKVSLIIGGVIFAIVIITAAGTAIRSLIDVAYSDPSTGNYTFYEAALGAAPLWLYVIPVLVGTIATIMVLREKE